MSVLLVSTIQCCNATKRYDTSRHIPWTYGADTAAMSTVGWGWASAKEVQLDLLAVTPDRPVTSDWPVIRLLFYLHLVSYRFCIDISNTRWSNTWYRIHSISASFPSLVNCWYCPPLIGFAVTNQNDPLLWNWLDLFCKYLGNLSHCFLRVSILI